MIGLGESLSSSVNNLAKKEAKKYLEYVSEPHLNITSPVSQDQDGEKSVEDMAKGPKIGVVPQLLNLFEGDEDIDM